MDNINDEPYGDIIDRAETLTSYWEQHRDSMESIERLREGIADLAAVNAELVAAIEPYNMYAYAHLAERHAAERNAGA